MPHALSALLLLLSMASAVDAVAPQKLAWDELPQLVGKRVSIPLYDGSAVSGKVIEVKPDALFILVSKSSNPRTYPKGLLRVPRANLHILELHKNGFKDGLKGKVSGAVGKSADPQTTTIRIMP